MKKTIFLLSAFTFMALGFISCEDRDLQLKDSKKTGVDIAVTTTSTLDNDPGDKGSHMPPDDD